MILGLVFLAIPATGAVQAMPPAADAPPSVPSDGKLEFVVTRNGHAIGTHVYQFTHDGERVQVQIKTDIDFKLLFIPVYRFRHESEEIWDGGKLASLVSKTDDNGEPVRLEVKSAGSVLKVNGQEGARTTDPKMVAPASLWNAAAVRRQQLIDTIDGMMLAIKASFLGEEKVRIGDRQVPAYRYKLTGDYKRELWYDSKDGTLLRVRFTAEDGSEVEYVRNA